MRVASLFAAVLACAVGSQALPVPVQAQSGTAPRANPGAPAPLKSANEFGSIADKTERSRALFTEIGKVLTHPRCINCHPAGANPTQGDEKRAHNPPVWREDPTNAALGTACSGCHTENNVPVSGASLYKSVPGHPRWGLAPLEMAWQDKTLPDICRQIKDEKRNGGRTLAMVHEHMAKDDLVAWGWKPGVGREPAPGSQEVVGELVKAWIDTGAECPLGPPSIRPQ